MLCLADPDGAKQTVFMPPDQIAGRTGCFDDRGLPAISGDTSDLKWTLPEPLARPVFGPLLIRGNYIAVHFGQDRVLVDPATGQVVPQPVPPAPAGPRR